jgi:ATP-dependent Clp protease ATP-binding subunit ClpC
MAVVKRVMQYQPELASGWELLGDICRNMEDFESAKQAYRRATQLNLENASVSAKLNRCLESEIKRQAKKSEEAKTAGEDKEPVKLTEEFLIDMSAEAERGAYHPILWRDREIEQIIEILSCKDRNSPLLIGEPGVGKTAIVEELARRIFSGEFPQTLAKKIFLMSVATLLAGAKFRGQFEERILQLIKELKKTDCILFIDDTHTIVNSGLTKGGVLDTSTLLKPALLRGEIQAIGATSYDEYRLNFEKDPSLVRCFQPVFIEEPTPEMMVDILRDTTARLAAFHGVEFDDVNFLELARLIKFCLKERKLPDIAINVFDRAAAKASLRRSARSKHEQESGPQETLPASAIVRLEDILEVISDLSGVPAQKLSADQNERFLKMESLLAERVVGQQEAIETVSGVIRTVKLNLDLQPHRPDGVFLFVGPSGVGKTELARALAEFLFGDESKLIRIDMSEYMEKIASSRLIGASPGYVGYNDQNQLTDMVRKNPYSLVLLDEIEKADAQMISIFLQVFDAGRLTDGKGRTVHFDNCTIIMTSNIGSHLYSQARVGYGEGVEDKRVTRGELRKEIRRFFSPEFLNRIDEVVFFNPLTLQDIKEIAKLQLKDVRARMEKDGVRLTISEGVLEKIAAEGFSPEYGARNLGRIIRKMILDPLAYKMLGRAERGVREVRVVMNGEAIEFGMLTETESRERASVELSEEAEPRVEKKENLP